MNARSNISASDELRPLVSEVITRLRRTGSKARDAVTDAAQLLGLSPRAAQALHWGEIIAGRNLDPAAVRDRYARWLADEADRLDREAAALRARRAAIGDTMDGRIMAAAAHPDRAGASASPVGRP